MAGGHDNPFEAEHLIGHVKDAPYFEVPRLLDFDGNQDPHSDKAADGKLHIPQFRDWQHEEPFWAVHTGFTPVDEMVEPLDGKVTKFMVLEVVGALVIAAIFIPIANRVRSGNRPSGKLWNLFEAMLLFIRDQVARPAIGRRDADRFLPFLWSVFFFVLICNLLGMVPWLGSPTGSLAVTGALALITFIAVVGSGMTKLGPIGFWRAQVPHMDLPGPLAIFLKPMIFLIEILGLCIKHFVLSVRLLANMMAGHMVLAVVLAFILASAKIGFAGWAGITATSILGTTALSMLELFFAFLQAYIFAFLAALFIGMAVHPH